MRLHEIAQACRRVAATSSRLKKIEHLAACLRRAEPEETETAVSFLTGELRQGRIGIGIAALKAAATVEPATEPSLTLAVVDQCFEQIAQTRGTGSTAQRAQRLRELFAQATSDEQDFLSRLVLGELRQGALEGIVLEAIAKAAQVPANSVRRALMLAGDQRAVAKAVLTEGQGGLDRFRIQLFRPVQPMLAQTADDVPHALGHLAAAALEFKLDGARIQVHKLGEDVRVFTRRLNDVTAAVPEIVERARQLPAREFILDGEVLALHPNGKPHPFQTTMRRFGRKLNVERMRQSLPLSPFFFDCLLVDGQSLIDQPGQERFQVLDELLPGGLVIPRLVTADAAEAQGFLQRALDRGHEGIMAKSLQAAYEAGSRGRSWLKIKPTYTLDLVVLAAEWGHGRRQGWLSNLHLGARDPADGFHMIGKTFKGLTDQMLTWQTQTLLELEVSRDQHTVYVRPELVVEIALNEVQASPHYDSGLALRFARVKRFRPDKQAHQADTIETVRAIYEGRHARQV